MITEDERDMLRDFICSGGIAAQTEQGFRMTKASFKELASKSDEEVRAMLTLYKGTKLAALTKQKLAIQAQLDTLTIVDIPK